MKRWRVVLSAVRGIVLFLEKPMPTMLARPAIQSGGHREIRLSEGFGDNLPTSR